MDSSLDDVDATLLERYKKGELKLEEICTLRVDGEYPQLYQFYSYLLLEEAHTEERCGEIFQIILHENMDDFWKVISENLSSDRILSFIRTCHGEDQIFLEFLYNHLTLEQVAFVAKYLLESGVSYAEQVEFYMYWQEEIEPQSFAVVRTLAELGALDLDEFAANHYGLFNCLERWRREDV